MKRAFIVHRWGGNPQADWYPWLKKELEKIGFKVIIPVMPNSAEPQIESWVSHLKKVVGKLDTETYFVGHSIGCQTIMRYLEQENFEDKIPKIVFVAGWFKLGNLEDDETKKIAKPWLETPINFNKVKLKIGKLTIFLSSDEPYDYVTENEQLFRDKLRAKVIIEKDQGHFTGEEGITEIPAVFNLLRQ